MPTARLRIPYRKLARLRPAQIADLVEAASHEEGEEIIKAVGLDRELEADVFEELDTEHQREFLRTRSDEEAARLLATMAPDDAADLIVDLDQERRLPVLEALPDRQQAKVRALLSYNPETAGGLMSPDFLALPERHVVSDALEAIARVPRRAGGARDDLHDRRRRPPHRDGFGRPAAQAPAAAHASARSPKPTRWRSAPTRTCTRSSARCRTSTSRRPRSSTPTTR